MARSIPPSPGLRVWPPVYLGGGCALARLRSTGGRPNASTAGLGSIPDGSWWRREGHHAEAPRGPDHVVVPDRGGEEASESSQAVDVAHGDLRPRDHLGDAIRPAVNAVVEHGGVSERHLQRRDARSTQGYRAVAGQGTHDSRCATSATFLGPTSLTSCANTTFTENLVPSQRLMAPPVPGSALPTRQGTPLPPQSGMVMGEAEENALVGGIPSPTAVR